MSSLWNLFSSFSSLFGGYESEGNDLLFPLGNLKPAAKKKLTLSHSRIHPLHPLHSPTQLHKHGHSQLKFNLRVSIPPIFIGSVIFASTYTGQGLLLLTQSENTLASYQFLGPMCLCVGLNAAVSNFIFLKPCFTICVFTETVYARGRNRITS